MIFIEVGDEDMQKRLKTHKGTPFILVLTQETESSFLPPQKSHVSEIAVGKEVKFLHKLADDGDVGVSQALERAKLEEHI